ncbi:leucine-rich repeat domain-containing protein [Xylanibacter muris]
MNNDDWDKIKMMKENLFALDLSETNVKEIGNSFFESGSEWKFLHYISLPEGIRRIGREAFYNTYLDYINFPSTLESIDYNAFSETNIKSAILPDKCLNLSSYIFSRCYFLENTKLPDSLKTIPEFMYQNCYKLKNFKLPAELEIIERNAFYDCYNICLDFPEKLRRINRSAFQNTNKYGEKTNLIIPKNVSYIEEYAFYGSNGYNYAEIPVGYSTSDKYRILPSSIKTIRLNCPTVVKVSQSIIDDNLRPNITIKVPSFLVNSYKLDSYWYEFGKIEGFSTSEIKEWVLNSDLVLNARDRLDGTPSIIINTGGSMKINGTDGMPIDSLTIKSNPGGNVYGRMFSNADDVTVCGKLNTELFVKETNKWYYLSMPYDVRISDIKPVENNSKRAIRYYDGGNRAVNGASGSWKNFSDEDIIPAGTGFIFQASEKGWWNIPAMENETKQYLTSNNMFVRALAANESEKNSDKGWNLVGNPYQCWYNIHKLNFTAPITVRNISKNSYEAYSVIDDDYALAPNQAFFVQCPEGITDISFPLDGRQMTSVIESQSGAKPHGTAPIVRTLTDLQISDGTHTDRTRVVINEKALTGYEVTCDAAKFMNESNDMPQIYTYDNEDNKYAINERPIDNGTVKLGFIAGNGGCFTFSLTRNTASNVTLIDNEIGTSVNLMSQDYVFTSDAGTWTDRFELRFSNNGTTAINEMKKADMPQIDTFNGGMTITGNEADIYNMFGINVAHAESGIPVSLPAGTYIVKSGEYKVKVIIL